MMKFKVVPFAIPLLFFICGSVTAIEIYNKDNSSMTLNSDINTINIHPGNKHSYGNLTMFKLGLEGETKITENLYSYGKWQYKFMNQINEGRTYKNLENNLNLAVIGLRYKHLGSIDYGKNSTLINKLLSKKNSSTLSLISNNMNETGYTSSSVGGLVTYNNKDFFGTIDGLDVSFQYHIKNNFALNNRISSVQANGTGYSFLTSYKKNDFTVSGVFSSINRIKEQNNLRYGKGDVAQIWGTSFEYDAQPIYLAASYSEHVLSTPIDNGNGFANKTKNLEVSAQYKLLNGLISPSISYAYSQGNDIENAVNGKMDLQEYITLGTKYSLTKNINIYAEYKFDLLKEEDNKHPKINITSDNIAAFGINYSF